MMRLATFLLALVLALPAQAKILVFAASSMTEVVGDLAAKYKKQHGIEVVASFAGTGQLARQIEAGAPADIFISADNQWLDWLKEQQLIDAGSIVPIAGNRLVVAVRGEVENWADIPAMLTSSRFAMGEPNSVPAGRYAQQALQAMGIWEQAKAGAVFGENVRLAMKRLELGEVEAAIVYASDVSFAPNARVAWTFEANQHDRIVYHAAAVIQHNKNGSTASFLKFLQSGEAVSAFQKAGFTAVPTQ